MEEFLWTEKYRPKKIDDCILPDNLKKVFKQFVDSGNVSNLLLTGGPGTGKTTVAKAMLEEIGADYVVVNGSLEGRNIDTLRTYIRDFAATVSFSGGRKYVILDEADHLNPQSVQPALRNFMEEYSANCGFILTCNYKNKIIAPLHSRCSVIEFKINKSDKESICKQFYKRTLDVLKLEGVEFDKATVAELIGLHFPDFRRILNELQRYSVTGSVDSGILVNHTMDSFKVLITALKEKDFGKVRRWVAANSDMDFSTMVRILYDNVTDFLAPQSIPQFVVTVAEYQYKHAFVANPEINAVACFIDIMMQCDFK